MSLPPYAAVLLPQLLCASMFFSSRRKEPKAARCRQCVQAGVAAPDPRTHHGVAGRSPSVPPTSSRGRAATLWRVRPAMGTLSRAFARLLVASLWAYVWYHECRGELCSPVCCISQSATFPCICRAGACSRRLIHIHANVGEAMSLPPTLRYGIVGKWCSFPPHPAAKLPPSPQGEGLLPPHATNFLTDAWVSTLASP